nr:formate/nitrite transporter family protein [Lachnospiraceae bacterium]
GASVIAASTVANASLAKFLTSLIFPAGLAMVILNGTELFTGNSLMIIGVLDRKITFLSMLRNWLIVYIGNFIGSIAVCMTMVYGHVFSLFQNAAAISAVNTAAAKCNLTFSDSFLRGILCNVLVCVAVMMAATAKSASGKIGALFLPIMVFVVCGFEHCVANMSYITNGLLIKGITTDAEVLASMNLTNLDWYHFLVINMIPVTLGNIAGGVLTGMAYYFSHGKEATPVHSAENTIK